MSMKIICEKCNTAYPIDKVHTCPTKPGEPKVHTIKAETSKIKGKSPF